MDRIAPGVLAVIAGLVAGALLFVPFVAVSYRRRGGFSIRRSLVWAAALVYGFAILAYTLLPLPDPSAVMCVGMNLDPLEFVSDIGGAIARPGNTLTDPAVLQLALNILLFLPLGVFIRVLAGRGLLVAAAAGLGLSALVEFTQLTGVWGLYPCAYRVFDVDDLLTNACGALLGSLLSLALPRRTRKLAEPDEPRALSSVTRGRRLIGALCDALAFGIAAFAIGTLVQVFLQYALGDRDAVLDGDIASYASGAGTPALWLVLILASGQSIGDSAVQIRFIGRRGPLVIGRLIRWIGGVSGYGLLSSLPEPFSLAGFAFAVLSAVLIVTTPSGRGLPGLLSGMDVQNTHRTTRVSTHPTNAQSGRGTVGTGDAPGASRHRTR
ncbi:MAG: hypothetical protein K0S70_4330 [Microbacterium sp.]|jgi:hypothetical protein|nr:hypothetical protein [Microbacterium sp.]